MFECIKSSESEIEVPISFLYVGIFELCEVHRDGFLKVCGSIAVPKVTKFFGVGFSCFRTFFH